MPALLDPVEAEIVEVLKKLESEGPTNEWDNPTWTRQLKHALAAMGNRRGYSVYCSSTPEAKGREWMFDLIWIEQRENYLLSIPLVLESEWNPNGASDDFQKLLAARAERRVMILCCKPGASAELAIEALIAEVEQCKMVQYGERYLFACWAEPTKKFHFRLHLAGHAAAACM